MDAATAADESNNLRWTYRMVYDNTFNLILMVSGRLYECRMRERRANVRGGPR